MNLAIWEPESVIPVGLELDHLRIYSCALEFAAHVEFFQINVTHHGSLCKYLENKTPPNRYLITIADLSSLRFWGTQLNARSVKVFFIFKKNHRMCLQNKLIKVEIYEVK